MKLQNLIIIFLAIALPVIIILSVYINYQVDTATLKSKYSSALINAAHESITAFEMNNINDTYANVTDTKIRDIQAALNVFSSSLARGFGVSGASKNTTMAYVPAVVFTLYDGYYVYAPTDAAWKMQEENNEDTIYDDEWDWEKISTDHELKSYVHYSKEYASEGSKHKIVTINYTLDNYITVFYNNETEGKYFSRSGYLELRPNNEEEFLNSLGAGEVSDNARNYYKGAWNFTDWFNREVVEDSRNRRIKKTKNNKP